MKLNPQQFVQPMLGNMREDYPLMPEGGTTFGDEHQPLYRMMRLPSGIGEGAANDEELATRYLDVIERGGGDFHRRGGGVGLHWSHDLLEEQDVAAEYRQDPDFQTVAVEIDHPGRDAVMDWDNPDDLGVLERTVVSQDFRNLSIPEVPLRPGTPLRPRALHLGSEDYGDEYSRRIAFEKGGMKA